MFETIKLNKEYWKKRIPYLKYGIPNPLNALSSDKEKFSDAMTSFNFFGVFKTTQASRHIQTQLFLKSQLENFIERPLVLDIGVSDGSTSLDLINLIDNSFQKYYVTDYNIKCTYCYYKGYTYFFNQVENCFLVASKKFVFYPVNKRLFEFFFKKNLEKIKDSPKSELLLINKDLQEKQIANDSIKIIEYNIFEPWIWDKVDIIIVGNLLNLSYFTHTQIKAALKNCYEALTEKGLLIIIHNTETQNGDEIEKSTVYKKNNVDKKFEKLHEINNGIEIDNFILFLEF